MVVTFKCPSAAEGPVKAVVTAIQGNSAKSVTVKCRGNADTMEITARHEHTLVDSDDFKPKESGNPEGVVIANIQADDATLGHDIAYISGRPKDSDGNAVGGQVIFTTTDGELSTNVVDGELWLGHGRP